jgi:hypothetical protein
VGGADRRAIGENSGDREESTASHDRARSWTSGGCPGRRVGGRLPTGPTPGLSTVERSAFPPVDRRLLGDHLRSRHHIAEVAEIPQLLGCAAVLEAILVGLEGVQVAGAEPVDGLACATDQRGQLSLVVRGDCLASSPTLSPASPASPASHASHASHASPASPASPASHASHADEIGHARGWRHRYHPTLHAVARGKPMERCGSQISASRSSLIAAK